MVLCMPLVYWFDDTQAIETMPIDTRMVFADGFFSTMLIVDGQVLLQQQHIYRLQNSAKMLNFCLDSDAVLARITHLAQSLTDCLGASIMAKAIIIRAPQNVRGYGYTNQDCQVYYRLQSVTAPHNYQWGLPLQNATTAYVHYDRLFDKPISLDGIKLIATPDLVQLSQLGHGGEALCLQNGALHGARACVFWRLNGAWHTAKRPYVAGTARAYLLQSLPFAIHYAPLNKHSLLQIDALFCANAVMGILPIHRLDGRMLLLDYLDDN